MFSISAPKWNHDRRYLGFKKSLLRWKHLPVGARSVHPRAIAEGHFGTSLNPTRLGQRLNSWCSPLVQGEVHT